MGHDVHESARSDPSAASSHLDATTAAPPGRRRWQCADIGAGHDAAMSHALPTVERACVSFADTHQRRSSLGVANR